MPKLDAPGKYLKRQFLRRSTCLNRLYFSCRHKERKYLVKKPYETQAKSMYFNHTRTFMLALFQTRFFIAEGQNQFKVDWREEDISFHRVLISKKFEKFRPITKPFRTDVDLVQTM